MNLQEELNKVFSELKKELVNVNFEYEELSFKEDRDWLSKLETSYDSNYTYKEILKEAKNKRYLILRELNKGETDSKRQADLAEKLVKLNKVIAMYEDEFIAKEERKNIILFEDKKNKIRDLIVNSVKKSMELVDLSLENLKHKEKEILDKYALVENTEKSNLLLDLNEINSEIVKLNSQKTEFEKLLSYNGKLLVSVSTGDKIFDDYYKLIMKNGINMKEVKKDNPVVSKLEKSIKLVEKAEMTQKEEDIKAAYDFVNTLDDSKEKTELLERLNSIIVIEDDLKKASRLVAQAEMTKKEEDIKAAYDFVNTLDDSKEKTELLERIDSIELGSENKDFIDLLNKINEDIDKNNKVDKSDVVLLREKYQNLDDITAGKYNNDVKYITSYYNNQYENKLKSKIDETDIEKHSITDYIIETLGKPISLLLGTSLVKKINNKRLAKKQAKYDNASEDKKESSLNKLNKVKKTIGDLAVVSGVKLFKNRNAINKLKPRLYRNELTEKQQVKLEKAQNRFEDIMLSGLDKKINNPDNLSNKEGILNIFNQYLEDMSISTNYENIYKEATDFLHEIEDGTLSIEEIKGFVDQLNIIRNYRKHEDNAIYEYDSSELYDVIKYYDEDAKTQNHELVYMK